MSGQLSRLPDAAARLRRASIVLGQIDGYSDVTPDGTIAAQLRL